MCQGQCPEFKKESSYSRLSVNRRPARIHVVLFLPFCFAGCLSVPVASFGERRVCCVVISSVFGLARGFATLVDFSEEGTLERGFEEQAGAHQVNKKGKEGVWADRWQRSVCLRVVGAE